MKPTVGIVLVLAAFGCQGAVVGKTFEMTDTLKLGGQESATAIANEQCGWHLHR